MRSFTGSNPRLLRLQGASYLLPRMIESNAQAIEEQLDREEREAARLKRLKESGDYFDESELTAFADGEDEDDDDASAIRRRFDDDGDEEVVVEEESEDEDAMVKLGFPELKVCNCLFYFFYFFCRHGFFRESNHRNLLLTSSYIIF